MLDSPESRRRLLLGAGAFLLASCTPAAQQAPASAPGGSPGPAAPGAAASADTDEDEDEGGAAYAVAPSEDLMREHGVLNRVLLIYEESARRLDTAQELPGDALVSALDVTRRFVEEYHARLEEEFLFPRFVEAKKLVELVGVLRRQHQVGRQITEQLARLAATATDTPDGRSKTSQLLRAYIRMYRPHEAREDTVLFPAMRSLWSADAFGKLFDAFEEREQDALGSDGYAGVVSEVSELERQFGIHELDTYTARV